MRRIGLLGCVGLSTLIGVSVLAGCSTNTGAKAESDLLTVPAERRDIIARECFAGGLLTAPVDARYGDQFVSDQVKPQSGRHAAAAYQRIANELRRPLPELALQFVMSLRHVSVTLVGMRNNAHLSENMRHLAAAPLSAQEMNRIRAGDPHVSRLAVLE